MRASSSWMGLRRQARARLKPLVTVFYVKRREDAGYYESRNGYGDHQHRVYTEG
jgi:hypothetical protein